jgi:pantoate--beta-alanine ligase
MENVISVEEVRNALLMPRREGRTIGFVPTMGALHEGHLSLVRFSKRHTDLTVVSIFVNPLQFGPNEDFDAYPRDLDADRALLDAEGVDVLFTPTVAVMYPQGATTTVDPGPLGDVWCGAIRPGHFVGVATVVTKLLNIVRPDLAVFGEKDFQQLRILEKVARDLDLQVRVVGRPIVRESDGLAMSSRNRYLSPEQRHSATVLYRTLSAAHDAICAGETDAAAQSEILRSTIAAEPGVELEYAVMVDAETLQEVSEIQRTCRALVAARVGPARLIDNVAIPVPGECEEHSG